MTLYHHRFKSLLLIISNPLFEDVQTIKRLGLFHQVSDRFKYKINSLFFGHIKKDIWEFI